MFLSTLKRRTAQLLKGEGSARVEEEEEPETLDDFGGTNTREVARLLQADADTALVVHYRVQNGTEADRESAAFLVPAVSGMVSSATVRAHFPLPGRFHFRFRAVGLEGDAGSYVWVDMANDQEPLPLFKGGISMKALRLPADASQKTHDHSTVGQAVTTVPSRAPVRPDGSPSPPRMSSGDSLSTSPASYPSRQPSRQEVSAPGDLMELDVGAPSPAGPQGAGNTRLPAAAQSPQPKVHVPDRQALVKQREEMERRRVEESFRMHSDRRDAEDRAKADKVDASNKLSTEMDQWARTADGQAFKDIRTLLSTMHNVIWPGSGWEPLNLSELVAKEGNVKKYYRRAIILCHPDRHQTAAPEQQVRADRIFQALNEAFKVSEGV